MAFDAHAEDCEELEEFDCGAWGMRHCVFCSFLDRSRLDSICFLYPFPQRSFLRVHRWGGRLREGCGRIGQVLYHVLHQERSLYRDIYIYKYSSILLGYDH